MKRKIIITGDGSKTIHLKDWNEHYHSIHGAIQEAYHVFIQHGLKCYCQIYEPSDLSILEIGFGTGLNGFITCLETKKIRCNINYIGVEAYPVSKEEIDQLNYANLISNEQEDIFNKMHEVSWEIPMRITSNFKLTKRQQFFSDIKDESCFEIIYFDAFGARVQPELWTEEIFKIMYKALKEKGVLVTYSAKGSARRAMEAAGFFTERLQGPPGKRHMLRATKRNANNSII